MLLILAAKGNVSFPFLSSSRIFIFPENKENWPNGENSSKNKQKDIITSSTIISDHD